MIRALAQHSYLRRIRQVAFPQVRKIHCLRQLIRIGTTAANEISTFITILNQKGGKGNSIYPHL